MNTDSQLVSKFHRDPEISIPSLLHEDQPIGR